MAWSGGSFTRVGGTTRWADERDAGTEITAASMDTHDNDVVAGINQCVNKDGSNAFTGDADLGSNKVTSMAVATASADAVALSQLAINQIVTANLTSDVSQTSTSKTSTGLQASITLEFSTSRVIVIASGYVLTNLTSGSTTVRSAGYDIYRTTGTPAVIISCALGRSLIAASASAAGSGDNLCLIGNEVPGAGTHTYQVRHNAGVAGVTTNLLGSSGSQACLYLLEVKP